MEETLENARQELKRVDHLFWVSLKYTRTVDVIRNTLQRLINVFDFGLECTLLKAKEDGIIKVIPKNPGLKCDLIKKTYSDNLKLLKYVDFYILLRRIINTRYDKREEYRRHVTMSVTIDGELIDVNIDLLKEYYEDSKVFVKYITTLVKGEVET